MKLLKKLLPIVTIAATASAVVPMAVSCGTNEEFNGITDINFRPDKKHEEVYFESTSDAMKEYTIQTIADPNILVQDYYWTVAQNVLDRKTDIEAEEGFKDDDITFSVEVKNASLKLVGGFGANAYYLLSADIVWDEHFEYNSKEGDADVHFVSDETVKANIKNIPIRMHHTSSPRIEGHNWHVSFANIGSVEQLNLVTADYKFECHIDGSSVETTTLGDQVNEEKNGGQMSCSYDKSNMTEAKLDIIGSFIAFDSYYLQDCTY